MAHDRGGAIVGAPVMYCILTVSSSKWDQLREALMSELTFITVCWFKGLGRQAKLTYVVIGKIAFLSCIEASIDLK